MSERKDKIYLHHFPLPSVKMFRSIQTFAAWRCSTINPFESGRGLQISSQHFYCVAMFHRHRGNRALCSLSQKPHPKLRRHSPPDIPATPQVLFYIDLMIN